MLHLQPSPSAEPTPQPYAEAVARLASIRHALRLVDGGFSDGPESDEAVAASWDDASEAQRRAFDRRSERLVSATAAGLEVLLAERQQGREPNGEAAQALVEKIRRELAEVARVVLA